MSTWRIGIGVAARAVAVAAGLSCLPADAAEVYAIGSSTPGSFTYTLAAAIAGASNEGGELMRVQPYSSSSQFVPLVESGEIAFGLSNVLDLDAAVRGEDDFAGRPATHLRAVAYLFPFQTGLVAKADSAVKRPADLKGMRLPDFSTQPTFQDIMRALLANAGVAESDIEYVPIANFQRSYDEMVAGRIDVTLTVPGHPSLVDLEQRIGAIRFLALDDSPAAIEAMQRVLPLTYAMEVQPNPSFIGLDQPTKLLSYDYVLFANDGAPDAVVADVVRRLRDNRDKLIAAAPKFNAFQPDDMAKPLAVPYHTGAERFYRDNGIWPTSP
jgi:TRAP transporter TAXI family solute receptor